MPLYYAADYHTLEIIIRSPGIAFDGVLLQCRDLTWSQVFLAIDC